MNRIAIAVASVWVALAHPLAAEEAEAVINVPPEGSVSTEDGLAAWDRVYEVVSNPRCANCHTGPDNRPMWSGPSYGKTRPHGMNINAGESRMGAETLPCATCHITSDAPNTVPHAAPHVGLDWQLAPVEFEWFGKSSAEICAQLKDPERNGGRDMMGLAQHLVEDAAHKGFVLWGWSPGGTRVPAPYSLQQHVDDILAWGTAGQPCPTN
jgi:hypothetical protein